MKKNYQGDWEEEPSTVLRRKTWDPSEATITMKEAGGIDCVVLPASNNSSLGLALRRVILDLDESFGRTGGMKS